MEERRRRKGGTTSPTTTPSPLFEYSSFSVLFCTMGKREKRKREEKSGKKYSRKQQKTRKKETKKQRNKIDNHCHTHTLSHQQLHSHTEPKRHSHFLLACLSNLTLPSRSSFFADFILSIVPARDLSFFLSSTN